MKKDKLHLEKFFENQNIVLKIARKMIKGSWGSYTPDEDYIVDKISSTSIFCHMKGNKLNKIEITDESIKTGIIRIVKTEKPQI